MRSLRRLSSRRRRRLGCGIDRLEDRCVLDSTTVFNEIMYHPSTDQQTEWIELHNQMAVDMDLSGWSLRDAVSFEFPAGTIISGGGYLVVAADPQALQSAAGLTGVLGPWQGNLANAGERLELRDNNQRLMNLVEYDDEGDWPAAPDGGGVSLVKWNESTSSSEDPASWRAGVAVGGTPGGPNQDLLQPKPPLCINEVAGRSAPAPWLELVNCGTVPLETKGLTIRSSAAPHVSLALPQRTLVPGEIQLLTTELARLTLQEGDRLFLDSADGKSVLDATRIGQHPLGRSPDGGDSWLRVDPATPGQSNRFQLHDEIVINEIMYHPRPALSAADAATEQEWIELHNRGDRPIDLTGWRLDQAVRYEFPSGTRLEPGGYLVVARDASALRAKYPALTSIIGDFAGALSNAGDRIRLLDDVGNPADEVPYFDGGSWDARADGSGPSLELVDARADNARGGAWQASDEAAAARWHTYTYRGLADRLVPGEPTLWNEFAFGFLDGAGEALLDDFSLIEDPAGTAVQLLQNRSFDDGTSSHWRLLGNYQRSRVVQDDRNYVLYVKSDGATEYQGNQIETTFANRARLKTGTEYEISFRAKWLSGSQQINSRLYFDRLPRTTQLAVPESVGTPGQPNSRSQPNLGPTFDLLRHSPAVPTPGEPITVSVRANDPDLVDTAKLWFNVAERGWQQQAMTIDGKGNYLAAMPGADAGTVIQFYVEATDRRGAISWFPAQGPDSRALVRVEQQAAGQGKLHRLQLVMTRSDQQLLHLPTNSLSNERLGATVIYDDQVFYDAGVRLKGSFVGRNAVRVGFNIVFGPEQKFRGVHEKVSVDRSTHADLGVDEILLKQAANHAGGIPSMFDDLVDFIAPTATHTGKASLRMAGYDDIYLDSQYAHGSEGTVYEYEVLRWATTTVDGNPESLKRAGSLNDPNGYLNLDFRHLGDDKEAYRWTNLIVSNRTRDDYSAIIALHKALDAPTAELQQATDQMMDKPQWLRTLAFQALFGPADAYYTGSNIHNFRLYARPDGKVLYLPWDWDSSFQLSTSASLIGGGRIARVVRLPENLRSYYGHMLDIIETTFNADYMSRWTVHYGELGGQNFAARLNYIERRAKYAADRIRQELAPFEFQLTTPGPLSVTEPVVTVQGKAWLNVQGLRLAGSDEWLPVAWSISGGKIADTWQATLPLAAGTHSYVLQAIDYQGQVVGTQEIVIQSTASTQPLQDVLRLSELHYNPPGDDGAEFLELMNVSAGAQALTLDLSGVQVVVASEAPFRFAPGARLEAGGCLLLVRNAAAFRAQFPEVDPRRIAGEYAGALSNGGERIAVLDPTGQLLLDLTYDDRDPWPAAADGAGESLHLADPLHTPRELIGTSAAWRSAAPSPGVGASTVAGDFNADGRVDAVDIDLLFAQLRSPAPDSRFDLTADGAVDSLDRDHLIGQILQTSCGDANLDGVFDSSDLVLLFQAVEYEDATAGNSTWAEGDWDGDGDLTSGDLVLAFQSTPYVMAAEAVRIRHR